MWYCFALDPLLFFACCAGAGGFKWQVASGGAARRIDNASMAFGIEARGHGSQISGSGLFCADWCLRCKNGKAIAILRRYFYVLNKTASGVLMKMDSLSGVILAAQLDGHRRAYRETWNGCNSVLYSVDYKAQGIYNGEGKAFIKLEAHGPLTYSSQGPLDKEVKTHNFHKNFSPLPEACEEIRRGDWRANVQEDTKFSLLWANCFHQNEQFCEGSDFQSIESSQHYGYGTKDGKLGNWVWGLGGESDSDPWECGSSPDFKAGIPKLEGFL